jgi:arylsulfatase A
LQEWVIASYEPPLIEADRKTLPQLLKNAGYYTSMVGKWHLGWQWPGLQSSRRLGEGERTALSKLVWDYTKPIAEGPITRGFDDFFGVDIPNFPPFTFIENDKIVIQPTEKYIPDDKQGIVMPTQFRGLPIAPNWRFDQIMPTLTEKSSDKITELAKADQPFFLYFPMTSPHEPVSPSPKYKGVSGIAPIADFLIETDAAVGRILDAIDGAGIADNTLVIFTADNGHSHYTGWDALVAAGHQPSGPYRGHKGDIWEGGHRVPMIVRWPGKIEAASQSDQIVCLTDWMATFAELTEQTLNPGDAVDSLSFLPALLNNAKPASNPASNPAKPSSGPRSTLIVHSNHGEFAYRDGPWKLVYRMLNPPLNNTRGLPTVAELYNLDDDVAESNDLAIQQPARVRAMTAALQADIDSGATRIDARGENETAVTYFISQPTRWATPPPTDDQLRERLVGSWKMVGATLNGQPSEVHYSAATIKHITPTQFIWLSYSPTDRRMFRSAGGSWEVIDGKLIETARYGMSENFRERGFGHPTEIRCYFNDDQLTQYMVFGGDTVLVESWVRMQPGEDNDSVPEIE